MQEFDVAFHHNVMVKRKKRLIVLMALDRPTDLYDSDCDDASDKSALRQYLRQYTYINYAADDWLEKLLYALPVRGLPAFQNNCRRLHYGRRRASLKSSGHGNVASIDQFQDEHQPHPNYERNDVPMLQRSTMISETSFL